MNFEVKLFRNSERLILNIWFSKRFLMSVILNISLFFYSPAVTVVTVGGANHWGSLWSSEGWKPLPFSVLYLSVTACRPICQKHNRRRKKKPRGALVRLPYEEKSWQRKYFFRVSVRCYFCWNKCSGNKREEEMPPPPLLSVSAGNGTDLQPLPGAVIQSWALLWLL